MSNEVIHLNRVVCRLGREETLRQRLVAVSQGARAEPGCLQYDWNRADEADPAGGTLYYAYVRWADRTAFEAHLQGAHFRRFFAQEQVDPVLAGPPLNIELERLDAGIPEQPVSLTE